MPLYTIYNETYNFEIGIDEAGRGPMFGRLYTAAVILPNNTEFKHDMMKDSKKFTSAKKIKESEEYIKANAVAYSIKYFDSYIIDKINIREATIRCMHNTITDIIQQIDFKNKFAINKEKILIMVDGNDFKPYMYFEETYTPPHYCNIAHVTIKGGDNLYTNIAAASILAKVARDEYILDLCVKNPFLNELYDISSNKGYGTTKHIEGIKKNGITVLHRKTYGICKYSEINETYQICD